MMKFAVIFLALAAFAHGTLVTIPELGEILGSTVQSAWSNRTIHQFLSVKYGKSPSGDRRFAPPIAAEKWKDVYNATVQGIRCPQVSMLNDLLLNPTTDDMEDCLSMNIFTPMIPDQKSSHRNLLPVMVNIHGGGFFEGEAKLFPPNYLLEEDVLLVVPQYRLGPLGFLSLHTDGVPGNMGLMDQVLALQWINKYIKNFGGDNSRVTIFGQSAGGASVSALLISPMVEPYLFQKAIVQSGSAYGNWVIDDNPVKYGKELYQTLTKVKDDVDIATIEKRFKDSSLVEFLSAIIHQISLDPTKLFSFARGVVQKAGTVKFFTEHPNLSLLTGNYRTVPMMAGVTKHDGSYFLSVLYDKLSALNLQDNDDFLRHNITRAILQEAELIDGTDMLTEMFNNIYFKKVFDQTKNLTFKDLSPGLTDIYGVFVLKAPTLKQAKINAKYTNETYLYTFDYRGENTRFGFGVDTSKYPFDGGVHHSDDLLYLFPYPYTTPLNEKDTNIAKLMCQLWTSFAIDGKPTSSLLNTDWPQLEKGKNGPYLHINTVSSIGKDFVDLEFTAALNEIK